MTWKWTLAAVLVAPPWTSAFGQPFERQVAPFAIVESGAAYDHTFLGGLSAPRLQFADIDGDDDPDLFVHEQSGRLMFFENTGTPTGPAFVWRTDAFMELEVGEWARFADLDGDGDLDLLAEELFSLVRYYRNTGTVTDPQFALTTVSLRDADGNLLFPDRQNVPALADLSCDGRPDLLFATVAGHLTYYEHAGLDAAGAPLFDLVAERYQDIEIIGDFGGKRAETEHGANAITFGDVDADGDLDLVWGDFFSPSLYFIENVGSCPTPQLELQAELFPAGNPLLTGGYNAPAFVDIDGDGDLDLFAGIVGGNFAAGRDLIDTIYFFEQTGSGFVQRTPRFLTALDVGSDAVPAAADLDGDGDLDLVVGNEIDPGGARAGLTFFENTGSASSPAFRLVSAAWIDPGTRFNLAPAAADLDGDGDLDLLVGTFSGEVVYFRNDGTAQAPAFTLSDTPLVHLRDTPSGGNFATPTPGDLDGDGDLDLLVGESNGTLNLFRNDGTPQAPAFGAAIEMFGGIDAVARSNPHLADLDGDGDLDLVVGTNSDGLVTYRNTGTPQAPSFTPDDTFDLPAPPSNLLAPALLDIDADGDLDLLTGTRRGGLLFHRNLQVASAADPAPDRPGTILLNHAPNPFRDATTIQVTLQRPAAARLVVYDVLGREVARLLDEALPAGTHPVTFKAHGYPPGVYVYRLVTATGEVATGTMVHIR